VRNLLVLLLVLLIFFSCFALFSNNNKKAMTKTNFIYSDCVLVEKSCLITLQDNQEIAFTLEPQGLGLPVMESISLSIDGFHAIQKK
tara:strand:+ start:41731 stop:41991 length:261 start_codon:yes stop_codon:yes gene_type:complete